MDPSYIQPLSMVIAALIGAIGAIIAASIKSGGKQEEDKKGGGLVYPDGYEANKPSNDRRKTYIILLSILIFGALGYVVGSVIVKSIAKSSTDLVSQKVISVDNVDQVVEMNALLGVEFEVIDIAISPDGRYVVSSSYLNNQDYNDDDPSELILWDAESGEEIYRLAGHQSRVNCLDFSPDGKTILSGSNDTLVGYPGSSLLLWDVATGQAIRGFQGDLGIVTAVRFSPDGLTALSGSIDGGFGPDRISLIYWDIGTGHELRRFTGDEQITSIDFDPDGKTAITSDFIGVIKQWNLRTGEQVRDFQYHLGTVFSVDLSPDGKSLLSADWNNAQLVLWEVETGKPVDIVDYYVGWSNAVFNSDGQLVIFGGSDYPFAGSNQAVVLVNTDTWEVVRRLEGHTGTVNKVGINANGTRIITGGYDGTIRIWGIP